MDLVDLYRRSLNGFTGLVAAVHPAQWDLSTPCPDWNVRTLVNHVVAEDRWTVPLLAGATVAEVGDRFDGDLLGPDPVGAASDAANQAVRAMAAPGVLERTVHLSFGETPASEYARQLMADHLIHGWDLAVAIGADPGLDKELVDAVAEWFGDREQVYRSSGVVADPVELPVESDAGDRLLAAFGRDPHWAPDDA